MGRMIAAAPSVAYVHEPFNPGRRPGVCGASIEKWYTYVCKDNEHEFYPGLAKTLEFRFNPAGQWHNIDSLRAAAGTAKVYVELSQVPAFQNNGLSQGSNGGVFSPVAGRKI